MAFTCIVCGVKSYELMEEFCELREKWFRKWLVLPNGTPCYNTFSRVMEALDPVEFSRCILAHIHAVSAWACESGLTLEQAFVTEKSNEITARQLDIAKLDPNNWSHHQSEGRAHGRMEKRQTVVCHQLDWMEMGIRAAWKGLESIIMVERRSTTSDGKTRSQRSYT